VLFRIRKTPFRAHAERIVEHHQEQRNMAIRNRPPQKGVRKRNHYGQEQHQTHRE
jgi:hypothetical protein